MVQTQLEMSKKQLVGSTGQQVQAGGSREVLVGGQEVWGEWMAMCGKWWGITLQSGGGKATDNEGQWSRQQ